MANGLTREHQWTIELSLWSDETFCAEIWRVETANPDGSVIAELAETCNDTTLSGALNACARYIKTATREARR